MKSEEKIVLGLVVAGFLWQTGATTQIIEVTKTIYKEVVKILKKGKELAEKIMNWNWKAILTALATSFVMWKSFPLFLRTAALIGGGFPVALMLAVAVGVTSSIAVGTAIGLKFQEDVEAENEDTKEQIEKGQGTTNNSLPSDNIELKGTFAEDKQKILADIEAGKYKQTDDKAFLEWLKTQ